MWKIWINDGFTCFKNAHKHSKNQNGVGKNLPKGDNNIFMDYFIHELYPRDCGNECSAKVEKRSELWPLKR